MGLMTTLKRQLRCWGWELHRTDPDRSLSEHLWFLFPHLDINCVLDVGAGTGEYGAFLRENGYTGTIASFEPVPASFQALARRCADDPRWQAYPYALGSTSATLPINVTRNAAYSSFLSPSTHSQTSFPASDVERTQAVEVRRLDAIFDEVVASVAQPRVFLKLSSQGWDHEVLRGAELRLDHVRGLQSELALHPLYDGGATFVEGMQVLNRSGFAVSGIFDRPHHHDFHLSEVDCVMVRAGSASQFARRW
jgi:FkbM family methyltransferase